MRDPGRGASEATGTNVKTSRPGMSDYLELIKTKTFVFNTLGMAAVTFATGAYAAWGSAFYQRIHGLSTGEAGQRIGLVLVGAGLIGIVLGMFVPDLLYKVTKRAYLLLAAIAVMCSIPLGASVSSTETPIHRLAICFAHRYCSQWCSGRVIP